MRKKTWLAVLAGLTKNLLRHWSGVLVAAAMALAQTQSSAAIREVTSFGATPNDTTDDAAAIQKAIEAANAGDTVSLPAGTFLINHALRAKSGVRIKGAGRDQTVLQFNADKQTDFFDLSGTRNVELSGFTIDGKGSAMAHHGILGRTGGGHFIHELTIENLGSANGPLGIQLIGTDGKYTNGVTDCVIADNTIRNIGTNSPWGGGIRLSWGCLRNQVLRNVIDNTGRGGIFANDGSSDLVISSNVVTRSGRKTEKLAIEIWRDCDRVVIEDNRVDHWLSIGGASQVGARRNIISPPAGDIAFIGIEMIGQDLVVTDNLVDGGEQIGVSISNNASNQWHYCAHNTIQNIIQWGSQVQGDKTGARMLYFYANKFLSTQRGNPKAIYPRADGRGFRFNGNCQQVTLDSNEISRNRAEGLELGGKGLDQISIVNNIISSNGFAAVGGNPGVDLEWNNNTVTGNGDNKQLTSRGFPNPKPAADFSCPASIAAGQPAKFTNETTAPDGGLGRALWDFGEGVPSNHIDGIHTYSRAGTYRVTLVVWDKHGRGAIKERTVTVQPVAGSH